MAVAKRSKVEAGAATTGSGPVGESPERASRRIEEEIRFADADLLEWMMAHPAEVAKQRLECLKTLRKQRCSYGEGGILPLTLTPMLLTRRSEDRIRKVIEILDRVVDKIILAYVADPAVRRQFAYPEIPAEWLLWDPGYPKPTVISRHDALYDGKSLKFIEFNCDNPGGRAWVDVAETVYRTVPMYQDMLEKWSVRGDRRLMRTMMEVLLRYWEKFSGSGRKPRIGLTSFKSWSDAESDIFRDFLIEHGVEANFVDSRELEHRSGGLYTGNVKIDVLQTCLRFVFFKRFPREHQDFYDAIRDRSVMAVNPFRAHVGSLKENMAFMTNPENHGYFTPEEVECVKAHVPWTRRMDETVTMSPDGRDISLTEYALKNREKLVLKITSGAGGESVYVGRSSDAGKWKSAVEVASGCPWWILQEACDIPQYEIPVLKDGRVQLEKKHVNLNPYVFDGKYVATLARVSDSSVINVASGGGIMPVFEARG